MIFSRKTRIAIALALLPRVLAHTWIDNISSGESTGFIRGFVGHIDGDETYKTLTSTKGVALCADNQLDPNNYTTKYPRLVVKAGDSLVANYTENGHVTLDKLPPDNKPHPGNYSWFWTGIPFTGSATDGSQLATFDDLDDSNLLAGPFDFDDGRCAQSSDNTMGRKGPINCQAHATIPVGTAPGVYALYWVWDFTKLTAVDPSYVEMYTSCMDVEVVADAGSTSSTTTTTTTTTITKTKGGKKTATTASCDSTDHPKPHSRSKTRTHHHTKTVTHTPKAATQKPPCESSAPNSGVEVVYTTIYTEKFITVTRSV